MEHPIIKKAQLAGASFKTEADKEKYVKTQRSNTGRLVVAVIILVLIYMFVGFMGGMDYQYERDLQMIKSFALLVS